MKGALFPRTDRDIGFPVVGAVLLFVVAVTVGLGYQSMFGGAAERLVTIALINAIIVIGIQIYVGNTGILSFGHIGFGAIAGYAFAVLAISPAEKAKRIPDAPFGLADVHLNPWVALAIAVVFTVVVAAIVGLGLARSGAESGAVAATVITLALLFVSHEVARNWPELTGGDRAGLSFRIGGNLKSRIPIYLGLLGALVIARLFAQSRAGRLAKAAREDNLAARAMGVNPLVQQTAALLLSVAVVSVGSGLLVYETGSILPGDFFFDFTLLTLVMLIVGGNRSVTGAVVGVAVMTIGREIARRLGQDGFEFFGIGLDGSILDLLFRENLQTVFLGVAMLGFMIWRPLGLLNDWELDTWLYRRFGRADAPQPPPTSVADERPAAAGDVVGVGAASTDQPSLVVRNANVSFGGFQALDGAHLEASTDEVVGLIGPNGAGKTTLLNVVTGLVPPNAGSVLLHGQELSGHPSYQVARAGLVRTFQNLRLFSALTVEQNVEVSQLVANQHRQQLMGLGDADAPPSGHSRLVAPLATDELLAAVGLWDQRHRRASELDYGNSRRLELARAAAMVPQFLLLDEPTSGMSDTESLAMVDQIKNIASLVQAGVIVIDHDLAFITGICDRIYCLDAGRVIAEGTPTDVQQDPAVQAAYLGMTN